MKKESKSVDPQSVFCEVCMKLVPKSEALMTEARDHVAYFCGLDCYDRWHGERAPEPAPHEVQEGSGGLSKSRDDRVKRLIKQHPQRDEPKADSVERDDMPPP